MRRVRTGTNRSNFGDCEGDLSILPRGGLMQTASFNTPKVLE
jgi:hypothetical protein